MEEKQSELEELLRQVQTKYGKSLCTPKEFQDFLVHIDNRISLNTLKRLFGYSESDHKTRLSTLNVLANYLGFTNYSAFTSYLANTRDNSSTFVNRHILTEYLTPGNEVEIGWGFNRHIRLRYLGQNVFEVLEAHFTKLEVGDRFESISFIEGQPLQVPYILRQGKRTPPFIAGCNGGLTQLNLVTA